MRTLKLKLSRKGFFLLLILILASFLRLWRMWEWPLTVDEADSATRVIGMIKGEIPFYASAEPYQGSILGYFSLIPIFLFGNNIFFLRLPIVLTGILSIVFLYKFTKKYYNENVALISAFVLAITPNDILGHTLFIEYPLILFFALLSVYIFSKYQENNKIYLLYLLSFVFGIGIITRPTFNFFMLSFLITIAFYPNLSLYKMLKNIKLKNWLLILSFFILGTLPLIYDNMINGLPVVKFILNNVPIAQDDINLLDVKKNLSNGYNNFIFSLDNNIRNRSTLVNTGYNFSIIFFLSLFLFLLVPIKKFRLTKDSSYLKRNFYIFANFIIILTLLSTITITDFYILDHMMLYPFYSIIIGWSIFYVYSLLESKKVLVKFFLIFISIIFISNLVNFVDKYSKHLELQRNDFCLTFAENFFGYKNFLDNTTIVFPTVSMTKIYEFYNPNASWFILTLRHDTIDMKFRRWDNYLQMTNLTYVLTSNKCNAKWARDPDLNISQDFIDYVNSKNRTIIINKTLMIDNSEVFKIIRIG